MTENIRWQFQGGPGAKISLSKSNCTLVLSSTEIKKHVVYSKEAN